jgi:hypothetical protein
VVPIWERFDFSLFQLRMEATPSDDANELEPPDDAAAARIAAVRALEARIKVEEQAERAKLRAEEAQQAHRAALEAAEQAKLAVGEAERAQHAADEEAEQARLAAEDALQAWRRELSRAVEAETAAVREEASASPAPAAPLELRTALHEQVTDRIAEPEERPSLEAPNQQRTCVITHRREDRRVVFYARAFDEEGREQVLAESAQFKSRGSGAPDRSEQAAAALDGLVAELTAEGWEPVGVGDTWFAQVFRRRVRAAPA